MRLCKKKKKKSIPSDNNVTKNEQEKLEEWKTWRRAGGDSSARGNWKTQGSNSQTSDPWKDLGHLSPEKQRYCAGPSCSQASGRGGAFPWEGHFLVVFFKYIWSLIGRQHPILIKFENTLDQDIHTFDYNKKFLKTKK